VLNIGLLQKRRDQAIVFVVWYLVSYMRDRLATTEYWDKWIEYVECSALQDLEIIKAPSANAAYRPQFIYRMACSHYEQLLRKYSRGDSISTLVNELEPLIDLWEESDREGFVVWTEEQRAMRSSWSNNLDFYIISFWLVSFSLVLDLRDDLWKRLLVLIGNEGEDKLLDMIIATRQPGRRVGSKLCHPRPYGRLLIAIESKGTDAAAAYLRDFVDNWFKELDRHPKKELSRETTAYARPYWYDFGSCDISGGAYFGRWCVEAVGAVRAFCLDDSLCIGHPAYPGDLLRPEGPTTHTIPPGGEIGNSARAQETFGKSLIRRIFRL
jgi:hypothetical protein